MTGYSLLTAVITLSGGTIAYLMYRVGALSNKVNQLDTGVRIVAGAQEAGFESVQHYMHENLQQMAEIIAMNLNDHEGGTGV